MENQTEYGDKTIFNFEEYRKQAMTTCQPQCFNEEYLELGLISEIGEISGKLKRVIRDGDEIDNEDMIKELGDVLWYITILVMKRGDLICHTFDIHCTGKRARISEKILYLSSLSNEYVCLHPVTEPEEIFSCIREVAESLGATLQEVADTNIKKLYDRKKRNKINGAGDNR